MPGCQDPGPLEDLRGTVKDYGRHVLACAGDTPFGPRVEKMEGTLLGTMGQDAKVLAATEDLQRPPKFTALRTPSASDEGLDLLVFPEAVRYRGVTETTWGTVKDEHLVGGAPAPSLDPEPLDGIHVLVCTHAARDERCGNCGPRVVEAFRDAVRERRLDDVTIHPSSHVGGHRYAGNVLVYPGGTWYGYVRPPDVGEVLDAHRDGGVWEAHYRGEMLTP